ncbi:twin-arginine translocation signal domain-containing protein, partial [Lutimonas sp.]|uniref:twin-arginine translocation signal domain-containing protein n=1 Tax=Lutimonas sp. TaxID=1872403 RepID=UPI003C74DA93
MRKDRRNFIKKAAAGAVGVSFGNTINAMTAKSYKNIMGANDRINLAIQGLGRRYPGFIDPIADKNNNVRLLYLCDVLKSQREKAAVKFAERIKHKPVLENDIRKILEDKDVDAVFMATPDHWHTPGA